MIRMLLLIISLVIVSVSYGQQSIEVQKISIFTDGNSYVQKSGKIKVIDKQYVLENEELPIARYGTLDISCSDHTLKSISSNLKPSELVTPVTHLRQLLLNNIDKTVSIITDKGVYTGSITKVLQNYLVLDEEQSNIIKLSNIESFKFAEKLNTEVKKMPTKSTSKSYDPYGKPSTTNDNSDARVTLHFSESGNKEIELSYLQKGISWNPNYSIELIDKSKAKLTLQAEIINDIEDLHNAEIDLIVGQANFQYDNYLTDLIDFNNKLDPYYENPNKKNGHYNAASLSALVVTSNRKTDTKYHDFQAHKLHEINIDKNARAIVKIYQVEIPYKHIYECTLTTEKNNNSYNSRNKDEDINAVYHSLLIDNRSNVLIGRGAVLVLDTQKGYKMPIAQSKVNFIPVNSQGTVRLTQNHEIEVSSNQKILMREKEEVEFWGRDYYQAIMEGTVIVANYNQHPVELHIESEIKGELKADNKYMQLLNQKQGFKNPNAVNTVQWKLQLKAGETREVKYQYEVYID